MRTPEQDLHFVVRQNRLLKHQIKLLFKELGWSEETIAKWKREGSLMRTTQNSNDLVCLFIEDLPGGACLVSTPDGEMSTDDMDNGGNPFYLKDGREIFYPGWVSW